MGMNVEEAYALFDTWNYTDAELEIIYGDAPKIENMKVWIKLIDKVLDKYHDYRLFNFLTNKYDYDTGEMRDIYIKKMAERN